MEAHSYNVRSEERKARSPCLALCSFYTTYKNTTIAAKEIGLVNEVVPAGQLMKFTYKMGKGYSTRSIVCYADD